MNELLDGVGSFFINDYGDLNLLGKIFKIAIVFIITKIVIKFISRFIKKTLDSKRMSNVQINDKRAQTLGRLADNTVKYILYFIVILIALEEFGIKTASIIATAGIGGIAIGFGAQSLVKDIITGFFILLEDQFSVGDYVKIGSDEGIVEELGLRITQVRDFNGQLHIIPNSSIQVVTNRNKGSMRAWVDIHVPFDEDMNKVNNVLEKVCTDIKSTNEDIVDGPSILGITSLGESHVRFTIIAHAKAGTQWSVERAIRKRVVEKFDEENIKIPYPRKVIVGGEQN